NTNYEDIDEKNALVIIGLCGDCRHHIGLKLCDECNWRAFDNDKNVCFYCDGISWIDKEQKVTSNTSSSDIAINDHVCDTCSRNCCSTDKICWWCGNNPHNRTIKFIGGYPTL